MKTARILLSLVAVAVLFVATVAAQTVAIRGGTVYTLAGAPIEGGTIVIENGLISSRISSSKIVTVPFLTRALNGSFGNVTCMSIFMETLLGLMGWLR